MTTVWIVAGLVAYLVGATIVGAGILRSSAHWACSKDWRYQEDRVACERRHGLDCWSRRIDADTPEFVFGTALWPITLPFFAAIALAKREPRRDALARDIERLEREAGL